VSSDVSAALLSTQCVRGAHGIEVGVDLPLAGLDFDPDVVVLPGGGTPRKDSDRNQRVILTTATPLRSAHP
jgi:hypothetical protein